MQFIPIESRFKVHIMPVQKNSQANATDWIESLLRYKPLPVKTQGGKNSVNKDKNIRQNQTQQQQPSFTGWGSEVT